MGRRLGQHFLQRQSVLERIAAAACGEHQDLVLEIGPGKGALTRALLERAARVVAVELDPPLVEHLRRVFRSEPRLEVVHADILGFDLSGFPIIAGNLPYYITSPILDRVLAMPSVERAVFLMQKEVAERLVAQPGTRDYGYLTVATQLRADVELLSTVPAAAFSPPPKVDSAIVRLNAQGSSRFGVDDTKRFLKFVAAAFRHKRKTLRNNLTAIYPKHQVDALPEAGLRAEQISLARLVGIYQRLEARKGPAAALDARE